MTDIEKNEPIVENFLNVTDPTVSDWIQLIESLEDNGMPRHKDIISIHHTKHIVRLGTGHPVGKFIPGTRLANV